MTRLTPPDERCDLSLASPRIESAATIVPCQMAPSESEARFHAIIESAGVLLWTSDTRAHCNFCNKAFLEFCGLTLDQVHGLAWTQAIHPEDRAQALNVVLKAAKLKRRYENEFRLRRHDGEYRWVLDTGMPQLDPGGNLVGFVGSCIDITNLKCAQVEMQQLLAARYEAHAQLAEQTERLHHLAESDPLTGILNRRSFREQFDREWSRAIRHDRAISCIMLDIDFFKKINDTHGHAAGDAVLQKVAKALIEHCRPSDLVCRFGGEEFCVLLPETDEDGAAIVAERLRAFLAEIAVDASGSLIRITSSFGVAEGSGEHDDFESLIDRADEALRLAKQTGRNRVVSYSSIKLLAEGTTEASPTHILNCTTARDLMASTPCIGHHQNFSDAVKLLLQHNVGSAPVTDDSGKLVGFLSERDLISLGLSRETWTRGVQEIMKTSVISYDVETPCSQILQFLCRASIHRVVVVENGVPVGIISPSNLLMYFERHAGEEAQRPQVCEAAGA